MIIKLAVFTEEEESKIRKNLVGSSPIKSKHALLNYAHPAAILGGVTGGFAGSEIGDKIFGGSHMVDSLANSGERTAVPLAGRYAKNLFRGGLGAIGAGLGAYGVHKFREHQEKRKS